MDSSLPDTLCYLNGDYTPLNQAKVSVLDRGFIFGDGIYDVVPVYGRKLFRFAQHLARLDRNLGKLHIVNPHTSEEWLDALPQTDCRPCERGPDDLHPGHPRRGAARPCHAGGRHAHRVHHGLDHEAARAQALREGVACVTAEDFRWERGDIKSISLLGNVLARQVSADAGATETILFREGQLTEASSSNVWIVRDGAVLRRAQERACAGRHPLRTHPRLCEQEGIHSLCSPSVQRRCTAPTS